jgi:nucleotide-binding universal stress UspA family protein
MIEKILFPVDFSPSSVAMAAYVKRAAAMFGSHVTLLHVVDLESHNGFELYLRTFQDIADEHWNVARAKLDSFLESEFPRDQCPRILRSGEAGAQIAEVARTGGFDLIVMPTHAGRFRQMLLGSTTAKVLNDADCLVMTTEHAETIAPRPLQHRQWVCGIGEGPESERVLRLASRAAAQAHANLFVVHVADEHGPTPIQFELSADSQHMLRLLGVPDVRVIKGRVKEALIGAAQHPGADALIIGRAPKHGALGRIRDLTYSLIRDSPVPVLSV